MAGSRGVEDVFPGGPRLCFRVKQMEVAGVAAAGCHLFNLSSKKVLKQRQIEVYHGGG